MVSRFAQDAYPLLEKIKGWEGPGAAVTARPSIHAGGQTADGNCRAHFSPQSLACTLSENWPQRREQSKSILNYYHKPSSGHNPRFQVPQLKAQVFYTVYGN